MTCLNDTDSCDGNHHKSAASLQFAFLTMLAIAVVLFFCLRCLCTKIDPKPAKPIKIFIDENENIYISTEERQPLVNTSDFPSLSTASTTTYGSNDVTEDTPNASSINDDAPIIEVHNTYEDKTQTADDINSANESSTTLKNIQSSVTNDSYLQHV